MSLSMHHENERLLSKNNQSVVKLNTPAIPSNSEGKACIPSYQEWLAWLNTTALSENKKKMLQTLLEKIVLLAKKNKKIPYGAVNTLLSCVAASTDVELIDYMIQTVGEIDGVYDDLRDTVLPLLLKQRKKMVGSLLRVDLPEEKFAVGSKEAYSRWTRWVNTAKMSEMRRLIFRHCLHYAKVEIISDFDSFLSSPKQAIFLEFIQKSPLFPNDISFMLFVSDYFEGIENHSLLKNQLMPILNTHLQSAFATILGETKRWFIGVSVIGLVAGLLNRPVGVILTLAGLWGVLESNHVSHFRIHLALEEYLKTNDKHKKEAKSILSEDDDKEEDIDVGQLMRELPKKMGRGIVDLFKKAVKGASIGDLLEEDECLVSYRKK